LTNTTRAYLDAFAARDQPFLTAYTIDADRTVHRQRWTRGAFLDEARGAAALLRGLGLTKGDRVLHCFSRNHPADLIFRLASVLTGTVPVTVNWQADDADQVAYKLELTEVRLVLHDEAAPAETLAALIDRFPDVPHHRAQPSYPTATVEPTSLDPDDARIVIFTSGTTGRPKGVLHTYAGYTTNHATFTDFLGEPDALVAVNPLHHANATATCDWAMRTPGTEIHLVSRYSTPFWEIVTEVAAAHARGTVIVPCVAKHFAFLADLDRAGVLPSPERRKAWRNAVFLMGSAPVGPDTAERVLHYTGNWPTVRFGSTETCLQVMGIPRQMTQTAVQAAFERGWHQANGQGFFIGRPHHPHTEACVVRAIEPGTEGYLAACEPGQHGYLVTRGGNLMQTYVKDPEATRSVMQQGWYTGLLDIGFTLENPDDGALDFYWVGRESALLIRGGANYAYDQINTVLTRLLREAGLEEAEVAVVGLPLFNTYDDACCATVQLPSPLDPDQEEGIRDLFRKDEGLPKWARPDRVRFAQIPRNFKGAVLTKDLKAAFHVWLKETE